MSHAAGPRRIGVPVPEPWCRLRVERPDGRVVARRTLHGFGPPDLDAVDAVARLLLIARRHGARVAVEDARPELHELLELSGLAGLALRVEPGGEAELGEHLAGVEQVEEEAHLGDPPA
ncbi:MAG TPA: hypothetical protein PKA98_08445 [Acidimicrobiales bacterium]|nr:hypothetical protein [Acidimicrobiales bacterium]